MRDKIKLLSLFSGIGAFEKALKQIDKQIELVGYCEIDKYASKAYSLIHSVDENMNLRDVCAINTEKMPQDIDIITYGFPCQDISVAGKQAGFTGSDGELTRSGLFFEALRIIKDTKPKIAIAENVKALVSKKFKKEFGLVLDSLEAAGYNNYWKVLNAKDYGIPQNRERVFIISIRKDIDKGFEFPKKKELELRLKDLLENDVDEKYYLSEKAIKYFCENYKKQKQKGNGFKFEPTFGDVVAKAVTTRAGSRMDDNYIYCNEAKAVRLGGIYDNEKTKRQAGSIYDKNHLSPAISTAQGGNRQPLITEGVRVRKLTPKECFRLMGFDDKDCDILILNGLSNTQLYKMAGNSIVVNVLNGIFKKLISIYGDDLG